MSGIILDYINTIFLDLDGTLLETRYRQYEVLSSVCKDLLKISVEEFWNKKREGKTNENILRELSVDERKIEKYKAYWRENIESEESLSKDFLFEFSIPALQRWKIRGKVLHLVTMRSNEKNLFWQIERLNINHFFESVIVCSHRECKSEVIKRNLFVNRVTAVVIGDTEKDIEAGRNLDILTVAVLSGIRNYDVLKSYYPDIILNSVAEID